MMQELLTKGIGHVEFKDSPVGRIPVGWEVKPLEELCSLVGVGIASSTTHAYTNIGVALLRNQNILRDGIRKTDMLYITEEFSEQNSSKKIFKRDVISIRTGYPGVSAVVPDEFDGCHSFTTLISRPIESLLNSDYLALLINSDYGQTFVTGGQAGGAQQNLNSSVLKAFPVILPPLEEQKAIFNTVEAVSIKLRLIIERKNKILATKKALMQDLLTGKVRVKVS
jgi:type I restriction enzyme, S subunit